MRKMAEMLKVIVATFGGTLAYWLGGMDSLLKALIFFIVLDYCSGVIKAISTKKLSSNIGLKGISKKVYSLIIVAVAFVIERLINSAFPIREIVIMFFIANEGISILENASEIGVPIPEILKNALIQLREKDKED